MGYPSTTPQALSARAPAHSSAQSPAITFPTVDAALGADFEIKQNFVLQELIASPKDLEQGYGPLTRGDLVHQAHELRIDYKTLINAYIHCIFEERKANLPTKDTASHRRNLCQKVTVYASVTLGGLTNAAWYFIIPFQKTLDLLKSTFRPSVVYPAAMLMATDSSVLNGAMGALTMLDFVPACFQNPKKFLITLGLAVTIGWASSAPTFDTGYQNGLDSGFGAVLNWDVGSIIRSLLIANSVFQLPQMLKQSILTIASVFNAEWSPSLNNRTDSERRLLLLDQRSLSTRIFAALRTLTALALAIGYAIPSAADNAPGLAKMLSTLTGHDLHIEGGWRTSVNTLLGIFQGTYFFRFIQAGLQQLLNGHNNGSLSSHTLVNAMGRPSGISGAAQTMAEDPTNIMGGISGYLASTTINTGATGKMLETTLGQSLLNCLRKKTCRRAIHPQTEALLSAPNRHPLAKRLQNTLAPPRANTGNKRFWLPFGGCVILIGTMTAQLFGAPAGSAASALLPLEGETDKPTGVTVSDIFTGAETVLLLFSAIVLFSFIGPLLRLLGDVCSPKIPREESAYVLLPGVTKDHTRSRSSANQPFDLLNKNKAFKAFGLTPLDDQTDSSEEKDTGKAAVVSF